VDGLEPGKNLLNAEVAEGITALKLRNMQGHCGGLVEKLT